MERRLIKVVPIVVIFAINVALCNHGQNFFANFLVILVFAATVATRLGLEPIVRNEIQRIEASLDSGGAFLDV
jgi:hypothetical protein